MIGEATYIACRHKQQLLPSTKQELPSWIYVRGKVQFKSMCCLEGIECILYAEFTDARCGEFLPHSSLIQLMESWCPAWAERIGPLSSISDTQMYTPRQ